VLTLGELGELTNDRPIPGGVVGWLGCVHGCPSVWGFGRPRW
jgi:hypothetical protein